MYPRVFPCSVGLAFPLILGCGAAAFGTPLPKQSDLEQMLGPDWVSVVSDHVGAQDPATFEAAQRAFMALPVERRRDIQVLLTVLGYWPVVAVDSFGRKLWQALKNYQLDIGDEPSGILDSAGYEKLLETASPILRTWGMQRVFHPQTRTPLWIPRNLAHSAVVTNAGVTYGSRNEGVSVFFDYYPGLPLELAFRTTQNSDTNAGFSRDYEVLRDKFFVVNSHNNTVSQYTRFEDIGTGVVGFMLFWPSTAEFHGERIADVMSDLFRSEVELGIRRSPPVPKEAAYVAAVPSQATSAPSSGAAVPTPIPVVEPKSTSIGSGFFVAVDKVMTNAHVVAGCENAKVIVQGKIADGVVSSRDAASDLAVVETKSYQSSAVAKLRQGARLGEDVAVFGFPLFGELASTGNFTRGAITATAGLRDDIAHIQIDAAVQPGNSGGPLIDTYGNVVGVVDSKLNSLLATAENKDIPQNVNFAIKASLATMFLEAQGISFQTGAIGEPVPWPDLADRAKAIAAEIVCEPHS